MKKDQQIANLKSHEALLEARFIQVTKSIYSNSEEQLRVITLLHDVKAELEKLEKELKESPKVV